jgi:hypothetical protein
VLLLPKDKPCALYFIVLSENIIRGRMRSKEGKKETKAYKHQNLCEAGD